VFQVSWLHNFVHIAFGLVGLAFASSPATARLYLIGGGVVYLLLWFYGLLIDQAGGANFVPFNTADNWLHFALGAGLIVLGFPTPRSREPAPAPCPRRAYDRRAADAGRGRGRRGHTARARPGRGARATHRARRADDGAASRDALARRRRRPASRTRAERPSRGVAGRRARPPGAASSGEPRAGRAAGRRSRSHQRLPRSRRFAARRGARVAGLRLRPAGRRARRRSLEPGRRGDSPKTRDPGYSGAPGCPIRKPCGKVFPREGSLSCVLVPWCSCRLWRLRLCLPLPRRRRSSSTATSATSSWPSTTKARPSSATGPCAARSSTSARGAS